MADFYQTGVITTFHRLKTADLDRMEQELVEFRRHRRIALVLPITPALLGCTSIPSIMKNLR